MSKETKFTKDLMVCPYDQYSVLSKDGDFIAEFSGIFLTRVENKANAHLFKTAPKLYEKLEQIINMQENNYGDASLTHNVLSYLAKEVRNLLAEARGE